MPCRTWQPCHLLPMGCLPTETPWAALLGVRDGTGTLQSRALDPVAPDVGVLGRNRERRFVQLYVHPCMRRKMLDDGHIITTDCACVAHLDKDFSIPGSNPASSWSHLSSSKITCGPTAGLSHFHPQPINTAETAPSQGQPNNPRGTWGFVKRKEINPMSLWDWKGLLWSN